MTAVPLNKGNAASPVHLCGDSFVPTAAEQAIAAGVANVDTVLDGTGEVLYVAPVGADVWVKIGKGAQDATTGIRFRLPATMGRFFRIESTDTNVALAMPSGSQTVYVQRGNFQ